MINPHGGTLVNPIVTEDRKEELISELEMLPTIQLDAWALTDLECLAVGAFSPLQGFMVRKDYERVLEEMRLTDDTLWPIPITLAVDESVVPTLRVGERIALQGPDDHVYAVLTVQDIFEVDQEREAQCVYQTEDRNHPGVQRLMGQPSTYVGGPIEVIERPQTALFPQLSFTPEETRAHFRSMGWEKIVGFQTRNPIHRAHEYIQKAALETVDGLFIHPLVGTTKSDDIPAKVRLDSYEVLLENYYPQERIFLGLYPASMRYAGPREAIFHAIVRQNYGCTHFIVGRDHAGVGDYYGTYEAQDLLRSLRADDLAITPLFFEHAFYCFRCENMTTFKTCPHDPEHHLKLSGTKVRQKLRRGESLPPEFTRPEVARVLVLGMQHL